jgi:hypothetical protein
MSEKTTKEDCAGFGGGPGDISRIEKGRERQFPSGRRFTRSRMTFK